MLHRNLALKIAAVALAIFLWIWVTMTEHSSHQTGLFRISRALSPVVARPVPVVLVTGTPPPDLKVAWTQVQPPEVTIVGPEQRVREVTEVRTARVDLRSATGSFVEQVPLLVPIGVQVPNTATVKATVAVESALADPASRAPAARR